MANRYLKEPKTLESGVVTLFGSVTFGASGAIDAQSCKGFTVAQTADEAGRYTVTLEDTYNGLLGAAVIVVGPTDAALDDEVGNWSASLRNIAVATTKTLDIQLSAIDDGADDDPTSGNKMLITLHLKNSGLTY